ncbi:MAG: hypothetical protein SCARUB_04632 [Candidatus Scalindua rubra]|uniref:Uncharacterized protein n=1 Tax=Candidatus Scalindua rubra TaxID=1872076 RepID=A0A1E3X3S8_9BACT|nr:MAG: hypothetical protein SCARUB_04632 [Candidatus Scalindua rubra]
MTMTEIMYYNPKSVQKTGETYYEQQDKHIAIGSISCDNIDHYS